MSASTTRHRDDQGQFIRQDLPVPEPPTPEATPGEMEEALAIVRRNRQIEQAKAQETVAEPGYPKTLYNAQYKFENVAMPRRDEDGELLRDKQGLVLISAHYRRFSNGSILVYSQAEEAWIKEACRSRIFEKDTDQLVTCPTCNWAAYSHAAINVCMKTH